MSLLPFYLKTVICIKSAFYTERISFSDKNMELIPFWEPDLGCNITDKLWFVIHSDSESGPGMRTGHGSVILDCSLLVSCGANPDGTFSGRKKFQQN